MLLLLFAAPVFLFFELWQLVVCERHLGIKRLQSAIEPRELPVGERRAFLWTGTLFLYWLWMGLVLGGSFGRAQALCLVLTSLGGFTLRRNVQLKWILVVLTFEGAVRIGMLISLSSVLFRYLRNPAPL